MNIPFKELIKGSIEIIKGRLACETGLLDRQNATTIEWAIIKLKSVSPRFFNNNLFSQTPPTFLVFLQYDNGDLMS